MQPDLDPLGVPRVVRMAQEWGQAPIRAAMAINRPDMFFRKIQSNPGLGLGRILVSKELRKAPEGFAATISDPAMVILDDRARVHVVQIKNKWPTGGWIAGAELKHWGSGEVRITDRDGRLKDLARVVELTDREGTLTLLTTLWRKGQRAALELIERETAGGPALDLVSG